MVCQIIIPLFLYRALMSNPLPLTTHSRRHFEVAEQAQAAVRCLEKVLDYLRKKKTYLRAHSSLAAVAMCPDYPDFRPSLLPAFFDRSRVSFLALLSR